MKPEEAQLIEACLKRDERAYSKLYERFAPKMFAVCLRYTHSNTAAEDVMHDGFIKVFETLHKLRDVESLEAWMKKIMVYTAINSQRNELPLAPIDSISTDVQSDYATSDDIYASLDAEVVLKAMQQLPASFRTVLNLCEVEGYGFDEVAQQMGVKESTVRSALTRAKQMLAEKLKTENE